MVMQNPKHKLTYANYAKTREAERWEFINGKLMQTSLLCQERTGNADYTDNQR